MATAVHNNSMKSLSNGSVNHVKEEVVDSSPERSPSSRNGDIDPFEVRVAKEEDTEPTAEEKKPLDIYINNVVCTFSVRCHLNLRDIALNGSNVEYRRENGMITMKLRKPKTTASIWSSGKISCTGATSPEDAKAAARRFARSLQKLGFKVRFHNYRIVNVLGTCTMPWNIKITKFSEMHRPQAEYEPELHPGVTYKILDPKATLKIFSTGSVTVTAPTVEAIKLAIEYIYPLVFEFRSERTEQENIELRMKKRHLMAEELHEDIIKQIKEESDSDVD